MRRIALVVLLLAALAGAAAAQPGPGRAARSADEQIRQLYRDFTDAWNAHDARRMAGCWAIDGDAIEPDGMVAKGRAEIEKHFAAEQATAMRDSQLKLTIDSVWFLSPDVALLDGSYVVVNARDLNDQPLPPRKGLLSSVLIRRKGTWQVAASRAMLPANLPWRAR